MSKQSRRDGSSRKPVGLGSSTTPAQTQWLARDAFYKAGAGGFGIYVVPSLDMVIYKMAGNDSSYDPASTYDGSRDNWAPHALDQFYEGPQDSDTGVKRLLEMVAASTVN